MFSGPSCMREQVVSNPLTLSRHPFHRGHPCHHHYHCRRHYYHHHQELHQYLVHLILVILNIC